MYCTILVTLGKSLKMKTYFSSAGYTGLSLQGHQATRKRVTLPLKTHKFTVQKQQSTEIAAVP